MTAETGEPDEVRGFILQPTYRIEGGRAVVRLWGVLESGESFLVRDRRAVPRFWVRDADAGRAAELGASRQTPGDRTTLAGEPATRVEVGVPPDTPALRDRLERHGIRTFEADVRFAMRYLIDRSIRGSLAIRGAWRPGVRRGAGPGARSPAGVARVYDEPELEPAAWTPRLGVLSFDIETDPRARRVLSVALHGCGAAEVILHTPPGAEAPDGAVAARTEAELIERFARRVRELDPDVLTGWNVADFDFPVLSRRAEELRVPFELGRGSGAVRRRTGRGPRGASHVVVPGRLVLDGLALLRGAFLRMESYGLDAVAREVLGEGKTVTGGSRATEILRMFRHDRARLVEYNLNDARLVTRILDKLKLVELAVERSLLTGLPPDRVASSVAAFDSLYLAALGRRRIVAPSVDRERRLEGSMAGGLVFDPRPGLYRNVLLFDVRSLYPSLIRTFQIDPLNWVAAPAEGDDLVVAPNGAAFRRRPAILTAILDDLFPRRQRALAAGDKVASHAIKILMNSLYGVLGTPVCRFFNPEIAEAITSWGRELLAWARARIEERGLAVLYGDTDSLFVESGLDDAAAARALGDELVGRLNRDLAAHIAARWGVESRLEMELEGLYRKLFLPPARHGDRGARKRYAGLFDAGGESRVVFTGLEAVRRDWTALARGAQRELYERLFREHPVAGYLERLAAALRAGELDDQLVYKKALRKPLDAYTATTPQHVAAARKMRAKPGRLISYVMTVAGPEPAAERRHPFDYDHYLDKQLRPIAEPVLAHLGLDFAKVIGDDRQIELF